jgi:chemotaxis response regulator CheB
VESKDEKMLRSYSVRVARGVRVEEQCKVILFGSSMFMAGVEASLHGKPGLDVVRVDAAPPSGAEHLSALCPDVVVFDIASPHSEFALPLLKGYPDLRLIGLDVANNAVIVFSSQRYIGLTASDLAQLVKSDPARQSRK